MNGYICLFSFSFFFLLFFFKGCSDAPGSSVIYTYIAREKY